MFTIHADCGAALYAQGVVGSPAPELVAGDLSPCYSRCSWGVILESPNCWPSKGCCEEHQSISIPCCSRRPPSSPNPYLIPL